MAEWGSLFAQHGYTQAHDTTGNADLVPTVQGNATINTRGSWVVMNASTPFASQGLLVGVAPAVSNAAYTLEVGVGANGSEKVIFPDFTFSANSRVCFWFEVPVVIPAGSRVCVRCMANNSSATVLVYMDFIMAGPLTAAPGIIKALSPTPSGGTYGIATGVPAATWGAWTLVSSSCPIDAKAILLSFYCADSAPTTTGYAYQVAVGSVNNEVVVVGQMNCLGGSNADVTGPGPSFWLPCHIKAGSRVIARIYITSGIQATDTHFDAWVLG